MVVRPVSPEVLVAEIAELVTAVSVAHPVRVAIDGAPVSRPGALADALVDSLRLRGRPVHRVSAADFLRAASLRLEHGREDPDSYYFDWLDRYAAEVQPELHADAVVRADDPRRPALALRTS